ncbi:conserved hypothetical protein [Paraburkholderia piptadeniae]|uniref:Uncharacterized protein n=1 Tax=Paraburkholderia piptadeniae TaxID=1701573 RepID=A0A1N7SF71_9BURK|nr:hypothetical protein [Paraburkholderia piptadeniae]SIT45990.1 conserved hypothetical protein [Paraburkholderia piptadeniae]
MPTDNEGIERALKQAARKGMLVPVINRDWRSLPMTFRPTPAPLRWPPTSGGGGFGRGGGTMWAAFRNAGPGPLIWDGEPVLRGPYDPSTVEAQLKAARAALSAGSSDDGGSLSSVVEAVAGSVLGGDSDTDDDDGDGTPDMAESLADDVGTDDDASTPLGDGQPFEYGPDAASDEAESVAARGVSEVHEAECYAEYEVDMEQCQVASAMYKDSRTYALCTQRAFEKYQQCRGY